MFHCSVLGREEHYLTYSFAIIRKLPCRRTVIAFDFFISKNSSRQGGIEIHYISYFYYNFIMKPFYYSLLFVLLSFTIGCGGLGKSDAETFTVRVGSYNIHNAVGMDDKLDFDRIAKVIDDMDIDAIAIQELDSATERSNGLIVLDELAKRTNMVGTFNASIDFSGGKYGNGILTMKKPLNTKAIALPGREEERSLLIVEMEDYVFCCTHLSLNEADRQESMILIEQQARKYTSKPVLLAGDLNALPSSDEIKFFI